MRLFVLGATGHIGAQIVDLALARGHQLTAFVRSPAKITRQDQALTVVQGDPLRADEMAQRLPGHDAVLSALGLPAREALRPSMRMAELAASTVAAMKTARVNRLGIVSAAVLFPMPGLRFAFFRWFLRHHARDLVAMEAVVRATAFDFTIARPGRLVAGADADYRSARDALPAGAFNMSYRAVAAFLLDCVEHGTHTREIVGLARPHGDA
ncbi:MAG: Flavin reductase [bacterium]|nr:Flavin reductase [bacterium]